MKTGKQWRETTMLSEPSEPPPPPQGLDQWDLSISRLRGFLGWVEGPQGSA